MRLILRHLRRHRGAFLAGVACLVATNALAVAIPWMLKEAIEAISRGTGRGAIARLAFAMAATAVLLAIIRTASRLFILGTSRRIVYDIRNEIFAHLQTLPASFYARRRTGDVMSRAVNDLMLLRSLFGPGVLNVANTAMLYAAGIWLMATLDPILTVAAALPYPFLLLGVFRASRSIHQRSNAAQDQLSEISTRVQENLSGIHIVKAYTREDREIAAFAEASGEYRRRSLALARSRGAVVTLMDGLRGVSTLVVFWVGARHVIDGSLSLGGLVAFTSYLALLTGPTVMMGWVLGVFQRGIGAIRRLEEILAAKSDLPGDLARGPAPALSGAVTLRGLRFAFPPDAGGPPRPVLRGIDLEAPAGSTVGIVGRIGSGKSTLVGLIAGIHAAPAGGILIDGRDLNSIPTAHLRAHVGMVPQETFLFSRTIAENIALGAPDAPRPAIETAARLAQITRDLPDLPDGLDTRVGERGITLSGGQRQRVALARAILVDPRILILDDALASVDSDTEAAILEGLRSVMAGRTTFIIAHRASTVLGADRVVVLDDGRIVESGAPGQLLARDGWFARLHRRQQMERELETL